MYYRPFGKLGFDVSTFGMGAMRLAQLPDGGGIDFDASTAVMRAAVDAGVNYFDTAFVYHGGNSETAVGKAMRDGYRDRVKIATKLAVWLDTPFEEQLDTSLRKLETDHVDFYLFHAIEEERWGKHGDEVLTFLDKMVKKGKILYPSFSFHDSPEVFKKIIDAYDWKMAQVQFNFLDEEATGNAALEGVKYAGKKGVPIVVMEPLRGGALALDPPADVQALYDAFPVKRSHVEWAFRYCYDLPEVATVLSGISTMDMLRDNLRIFSDAKPGCMDDAERRLIAKVREAYQSRMKIGCTGCEYCMPCPFGVNIPGIFRAYDNMNVFGNKALYQGEYNFIAGRGAAQDKCAACGNCQEHCPQKIQIIDKLKEAAAAAV